MTALGETLCCSARVRFLEDGNAEMHNVLQHRSAPSQN